MLKTRYPASLKVCALLDKPDCHKRNIHIDYCGFSIPDEFVVGYGLDFDGAWRHLPYLAVLEDAEIAATRATQGTGAQSAGVAACRDADGRG